MFVGFFFGSAMWFMWSGIFCENRYGLKKIQNEKEEEKEAEKDGDDDEDEGKKEEIYECIV